MLNYLSKQTKLIYCLLGLAFVLRLLTFIELLNTPIINLPIADSKTYNGIANEIINGQIIGNNSTFTNPFYAYFIAIVRFIVNFLVPDSFNAIFIIQYILSILTIFVFYKITVQLFDKKVALVSSLIISIYEILIFFDSAILTVTLINFLNVLMLFLLINYEKTNRRKYLVLAGLVCGLSIITRANLYTFIPFIFLWLLVIRRNFFIALKSMALFMLGVLFLTAVITVRNYIKTSEFVIVSSNFGYNFYVGNNEKSNGTYVKPNFIHSTDQSYEEKESEHEAALRTGKSLSHNEASMFWLKQGISFIWNNPGKYFSLLINKLYLFFNKIETATNLSSYTARDYSIILRWAPSNFGIISSLGIIGIILSIMNRKNNKLILIYFYLLTYLVANLIIFVSSEYRAPLVMFLITFSIYSIQRIYSLFLSKQFILLICLLIPASVFAYWVNYSNPNLKNYISTDADYTAYGNEFVISGMYDDAVEMYLKAYQSDSSDKNLLFEIGRLYSLEKDCKNALRYYRQISNIELIPDSIKLDYLECEANEHFLKHEYMEASDYLRRVILYDNDVSKLNNLAVCLMGLDSLNEAEGVLQKSIRSNPNYYLSYANLGKIYEAKRKYKDAVYYYEKAVEINNSNPQLEEKIAQLKKNFLK